MCPEVVGKSFGDKHRAVLTARAANRHGQVAAVIGNETRQPLLHVGADVLGHRQHHRLALQEVDYRHVAARERAQREVVVGVGQRADVEDHVRVTRHAMLEAERFKQQGELLAVAPDQFLDPAAQRVGTDVAGVDAVRRFGQRAQQFALHLDGFDQRGVVRCRIGIGAAGQGGCLGHAPGERVTAACLGVSLHQRVGVGGQEQHLHLVAGGGELAHGVRQPRQRLATANVGGHAEVGVALLGQVAGQLGQELCREVVDAVVACIFQDIEGDRLAGAGDSGDEEDPHSPARIAPGDGCVMTPGAQKVTIRPQAWTGSRS
ncbi:hypothetical protein D3C87_1346280 [compost metagenome]